jgi:hypothetical protein
VLQKKRSFPYNTSGGEPPHTIGKGATSKPHMLSFDLAIAMTSLGLARTIYIYDVYTVYIYTHDVYTVFLAGKSPYIRSYTVYIHGSGQPLTPHHLVRNMPQPNSNSVTWRRSHVKPQAVGRERAVAEWRRRGRAVASRRCTRAVTGWRYMQSVARGGCMRGSTASYRSERQLRMPFPVWVLSGL